MITIETAESALKNIYLESVVNEINMKTNPFLTMVQKNTKAVTGKDAKARVRYGNERSVETGTETGTLPVAAGLSAEIVEPLKNLYGTFQISDKALRAAQSNAGAFAELLGGEMNNLISTAQANLNRMVYGNGMKFLGYMTHVESTLNKIFVPMRFIDNFAAGVKITVMTANNEVWAENLSIASVDKVNGSFVSSTALPAGALKYDRYYVFQASASKTDLNGIDSVFMHDKIYNLSTSEHKGILPCVVANASSSLSTLEQLDEEKVLDFLSEYEEHCQAMPADIILTHPNVRKALFEQLKDMRTNVDTMEMAGGFKGFSFNGIPMYADVKCKAGTLYALNSESFAMHQLCDWTWLTNDDGSILRQVDGRPVYSASLVKYADLICDKPFLQGKITNYAV